MMDILSNIVMGFAYVCVLMVGFGAIVFLPSMLLGILIAKLIRRNSRYGLFEFQFWQGMFVGFLAEIPLLVLLYYIGKLISI